MGWPASCIAVYSFEQNGNDLTGNGHNATPVNSPYYTTNYAKLGSYSYGALDAQRYFTCPSSLDSAIGSLSSWSIVFWIYNLPKETGVKVNTPGSRCQIGSPITTYNFVLKVVASSDWLPDRIQWGVNNEITIAYTYEENVWVRYNLEWTGTQAKLYANGTLISTMSTSINCFSSGSCTTYLGRVNWNDQYFARGYEDKVIFYNGLLNGADVEENLGKFKPLCEGLPTKKRVLGGGGRAFN